MPQSEFEVLQPRLTRFIRGKFRHLSAQDAEDLCQQAWLTLHRHRDVEGKSIPNAFPFLCQAAYWGALGLMRSERRCRPVSDLPEKPGPLEATPEEAVDRLFSERSISELLEHVPAQERRLARLLIDGESREAVEDKLGVSGEELTELWNDTCSRIIRHALAKPGNPLRRAMLEANLEERLDADMRIALDRAAANSPDLCLELAASL